MNVREATAADEQTLLDFTRAIWDENWTRPWRPPEVSPQLFEGKLVLLAEDEDKPVGFAFGEFNAQGYAHVNIVYVVPQRRRQGVTTALMREFAARAREAGIDHLTLDVATDNEVGREVWRRLGFTEWTRRVLGAGDPAPAQRGGRQAVGPPPRPRGAPPDRPAAGGKEPTPA